MEVNKVWRNYESNNRSTALMCMVSGTEYFATHLLAPALPWSRVLAKLGASLDAGVGIVYIASRYPSASTWGICQPRTRVTSRDTPHALNTFALGRLSQGDVEGMLWIPINQYP